MRNSQVKKETINQTACQPISQSMPTILLNCTVAANILRIHSQAILLARIAIRKSINGFPFLSYLGLALCSAKDLVSQSVQKLLILKKSRTKFTSTVHIKH